MNDISYDFDQYSIRGDAQTMLEANAGLRKSQPIQEILIIKGHCEERGTNEYNLVLGERRAQADRLYLQELGVVLSQIKIISYGKERPLVESTASPAGARTGECNSGKCASEY